MRTVILAVVAILATATLVGCSPTSPSDEPPATLGEDTDSEATLVTVVSTVPSADELPAAVAARLTAEIPSVIGVVLEATQLTCISAGLRDDVDPDALIRLGLGRDIVDQPPVVQDAIFGVFDQCVGPSEYGRVAAPILVLAGVQQPVAACVFRGIRDRLGFAGMYHYALGRAGAGVPAGQLDDEVARAYDACDLDPTGLTVPLGPPTTSDGSATTVGTTTTSAVPGTGTSSTVVAPVKPPTDPVNSVTTVTTVTRPAGATTSSPTTAG